MVVNDANQRVAQEVYLAVKDVDAAVCPADAHAGERCWAGVCGCVQLWALGVASLKSCASSARVRAGMRPA